MRPDVVAHRAVDYRSVTCLFVLAFFLGLLLPPFGGAENLGLGISGLMVTSAVIYYVLGDRLLFFDSRIEFRNGLGKVTGSWAMDGFSRLSLEPVPTQSRWGRLAPESLVLANADAVALALPRGRYTRQRTWSAFLLEQHGRQRLRITNAAEAELRARMGDG